VLETAQIVIVGVEAVGALALGALDLGLLQPRRDCTDDAGGDEVLQIEDVVEIAVEAIGPQVGCPVMRARFAALRTLPSST